MLIFLRKIILISILVFYGFIFINLFIFRWQPQSKFPFNKVKLPSRNTNRDFSENQEVEVLSKSKEQDTCGWWRAIIRVCNNG